MLDSLALPTVTVDGRRISTWRITAGIGLLSGIVILPVSALKVHLPPIELLAVVPILLTLDLGFTWLRRRMTGRETWVLYEHLALVLVGLVGIARLGSLPTLATLDAFWPSLCALMACGRCGCTAVGCCHGVVGSVGICYPAEAGSWAHGERRLPVQAVEAGFWTLLGFSGFLSLAPDATGLTTAGGLAAYAVVRIALEGWRADERGHIAGVPMGRWCSGIALATSIGLATAAGQPPGLLVVAGVMSAAVLGFALPRWLRESPPAFAAASDIDGFAAELILARPTQVAVRRVGPHQMGAQWNHAARTWALSLVAPESPAELAWDRLSALAERLGGRITAAPVRTASGLWFASAGEARVPLPPVDPAYFIPEADA